MESVSGMGTTEQMSDRREHYLTKFHGTGIELALIIVRNILLSVVTLGIYSFWGKVRVRQYLWDNSEFHGHRLNYTGTGRELFIGYLKVIGILMAISIAGSIATAISENLGKLVMFGAAILYVGLVPYVIFAAQRYLYSRTTWLGMNFGMENNSLDFVRTYVIGVVLSVLTIGLYSPVLANKLYRIRINSGHVGSMRMRYTGADRDAFRILLTSLPWLVLTLGFYGPWYLAKVFRFRAANTWIGSKTIGAAHGNVNVSGGDIFLLYLLSAVLVVMTLGLAFPWVLANMMSFYLGRFSMIGKIDFHSIHQVDSGGSAVSDGMASALDVSVLV
jgi:uncharacterized membrane protein YjgN (DUF898 family)